MFNADSFPPSLMKNGADGDRNIDVNLTKLLILRPCRKAGAADK